MIISPAREDRESWNAFIEAHYPPVGAFMETWEWGEFQKKLGRHVARYVVTEDKEEIALFTFVRFSLPFHLTYGYVPRGPAMATDEPEKVDEILQAIRAWAAKEMPELLFLRLEPPLCTLPALPEQSFCIPNYYIQPRYNAVVELPAERDEIITSFHPSTRSNLRRAEKRGVTVEVKASITATEYAAFAEMIQETIARNGGKNAYPSSAYFAALYDTVPLTDGGKPHALTMTAFCGYHQGELVSMHFVLFFAKTATYLYGASRTEHLNSKVDTYLHWAAMCEAQKRGYGYYDLGGIDERKWPSLTTFKRQFFGKEMEYVGNVDIPLRPRWYQLYTTLKKFGR